MKLPDVKLTNDAAWTTLEAVTYSRKVLESLIDRHYKDAIKDDFYFMSARRAVDLCNKALGLWKKPK